MSDSQKNRILSYTAAETQNSQTNNPELLQGCGFYVHRVIHDVLSLYSYQSARLYTHKQTPTEGVPSGNNASQPTDGHQQF